MTVSWDDDDADDWKRDRPRQPEQGRPRSNDPEPVQYKPDQPADALSVTPATEADVDAALARMVTEKPPKEKPGWHRNLSHEQWVKLCDTSNRIRAKTPIPCRCCGSYFLRRSGQDFANCPQCKANGVRRCVWCNAVFSTQTDNGKKKNSAKRCDGCLAKEAEARSRRIH